MEWDTVPGDPQCGCGPVQIDADGELTLSGYWRESETS